MRSLKFIAHFILILTLGVVLTGLCGTAYGAGTFLDYSDKDNGFSFRYPDYWTLDTDVDQMLGTIDGPIDLIHEENLSDSDKEGYKVLVHVDGSPRYVSNIAVLVHTHRPNGDPAYDNSEDAVQAVKNSFERTMASGTFFLEETYLGESHTFSYRRNVPLQQWNDNIRITYYITASRTHAYLVMETVLLGALTEVYRDQFNQVIQSFRVTDNESGMVDPSLDWGAFKPGEATGAEPEGEVGGIEIVESFNNNNLGWPTGNDAGIRDGLYDLDSRSGYPFTVTNTGLGQITFDFSFEGKPVFIEGGESAGYGLVFGYRDPDNYFAFLVTRNGQFILVEEKDGVVDQLIPWTESPLLTGDSHILMVQGNYQTLTDPDVSHRYEIVLFIDGNEVGRTIEDDILDISGWYGVFVSEDLHVTFEYLVSRNYLVDGIWSLQRIVY
jgi:hypothetical protein